MADPYAAVDGQRAMNTGRITDPHPADGGFDLGDYVDNTPQFLAGILLGALATLVVLRAAGFRFSFGASVGAGG